MRAFHPPCVPGAGGKTAASAERGLTWPFGYSQSHGSGEKTAFRTNPWESTSVPIHREGTWTEGTSPRSDPACSRSPGGGGSGAPTQAKVADRLFAGFVSVLLAFFFPRVEFPCNALTSNRGKQQSSERRSRLGEARGERLSQVRTGKSRQQPRHPAPNPLVCTFRSFFL